MSKFESYANRYKTIRMERKVSFSYQVMYNAFKRLSKSFTPTERAQMFHDTVVRVYRVPV